MSRVDTINYYNQNAKQFVEDTVNVDFGETQIKFIQKLKKNAKILDFGCGSGRDTKFFLENGFDVTAVDGSKELCRLASAYTGIAVKHMLFQELSEIETYDAIWACSSILHLTRDDLKIVLSKMINALRTGGIMYVSFKYGIFEGERNNRYFIDMTEETFAELLIGVNGLEIEQEWITADVRPNRGEEKWLNVILRKK